MRWIAFFALALLQSTIGSAAIFGADDRMAVSSRTAESRAVGTALYGNRRTTAFLVDKCFAVTSQHLVSMVANPLGETVALTFGRFRVQARAVRAGHMERGSYGYRDDWLLLQLDRCRRKGPVLDLADEATARPDLMLQPASSSPRSASRSTATGWSSTRIAGSESPSRSACSTIARRSPVLPEAR